MHNLSGAQFTFFLLYPIGLVMCVHVGFVSGDHEIWKYQREASKGYFTDRSIKVSFKSFLKSLKAFDFLVCLIFPTYIIGLAFAYIKHRRILR